jgi:tetrahydromethanopterin S-methyltransferase subunit C
MTTSSRLPQQLYAVRVKHRANGCLDGSTRLASTVTLHKTKAAADKHVNSVTKFVYDDETVELLVGAVSWDVATTVNGELNRG